MKLHNLQPAKGSIGREKRIGRGEGSGHGGTSTRGHKGAQSRSGYSRKLGFEGGQMPLQRRLPKFGFNNTNRVEYKAINLSSLQDLSVKTGIKIFDIDVLANVGLISLKDRVKILGNGKLTLQIEVTAHAFSKSAIAQIESLQGKVTII